MMPMQQSTLWCDVLYREGRVYPIQLCSLKMTFSSHVRYLSCWGVEVWYVYFFGWLLIATENQWLSSINFIVVGSGNFANTVGRELICFLGVGDADYSLRWWDNWLPSLRCPDKASKEDSCPAGMACPTLLVEEVCCISAILEWTLKRECTSI